MRKRRFLAPLAVALAVATSAMPAQAGPESRPAEDSMVIEADRRVAEAVPTPVLRLSSPGRLSDGVGVQTAAGQLTVTPVGAAPATARRTAAGRDVYPSTFHATASVLQRDDEHSARIVNVLVSAEAPLAFHWDFQVAGATTTLRSEEDGSVSILRATTGGAATVVGTVTAPWALDAENRPVTTYYVVTGSRLTQVVSHGPGSAYPITADPRWAWG